MMLAGFCCVFVWHSHLFFCFALKITINPQVRGLQARKSLSNFNELVYHGPEVGGKGCFACDLFDTVGKEEDCFISFSLVIL